MDRRTFIARFPSIMAGGAVSLLSPPQEETPERRELRTLLERATQLYDQARNLLHRPWRYDEAILPLKDALNASAQVWLRLRGVRTLEKNHTWAFTACNFRDEITGIGWNCACTACNLLDRSCLQLGQWHKYGTKMSPQTRSAVVDHGRRDLVCALDAVSQCLECTRHAFDGMTGPLPNLPKPPRV